MATIRTGVCKYDVPPTKTLAQRIKDKAKWFGVGVGIGVVGIGAAVGYQQLKK